MSATDGWTDDQLMEMIDALIASIDAGEVTWQTKLNDVNDEKTLRALYQQLFTSNTLYEAMRHKDADALQWLLRIAACIMQINKLESAADRQIGAAYARQLVPLLQQAIRNTVFTSAAERKTYNTAVDNIYTILALIDAYALQNRKLPFMLPLVHNLHIVTENLSAVAGTEHDLLAEQASSLRAASMSAFVAQNTLDVIDRKHRIAASLAKSLSTTQTYAFPLQYDATTRSFVFSEALSVVDNNLQIDVDVLSNLPRNTCFNNSLRCMLPSLHLRGFYVASGARGDAMLGTVTLDDGTNVPVLVKVTRQVVNDMDGEENHYAITDALMLNAINETLAQQPADADRAHVPEFYGSYVFSMHGPQLFKNEIYMLTFMEVVNGQTVDHLLSQEPLRMDKEMLANVARSITKLLDVLQESKLKYFDCDLKGDNILVGPAPAHRVTLIDVGGGIMHLPYMDGNIVLMDQVPCLRSDRKAWNVWTSTLAEWYVRINGAYSDFDTWLKDALADTPYEVHKQRRGAKVARVKLLKGSQPQMSYDWMLEENEGQASAIQPISDLEMVKKMYQKDNGVWLAAQDDKLKDIQSWFRTRPRRFGEGPAAVWDDMKQYIRGRISEDRWTALKRRFLYPDIDEISPLHDFYNSDNDDDDDDDDERERLNKYAEREVIVHALSDKPLTTTSFNKIEFSSSENAVLCGYQQRQLALLEQYFSRLPAQRRLFLTQRFASTSDDGMMYRSDVLLPLQARNIEEDVALTTSYLDDVQRMMQEEDVSLFNLVMMNTQLPLCSVCLRRISYEMTDVAVCTSATCRHRYLEQYDVRDMQQLLLGGNDGDRRIVMAILLNCANDYVGNVRDHRTHWLPFEPFSTFFFVNNKLDVDLVNKVASNLSTAFGQGAQRYSMDNVIKTFDVSSPEMFYAWSVYSVASMNHTYKVASSSVEEGNGMVELTIGPVIESRFTDLHGREVEPWIAYHGADPAAWFAILTSRLAVLPRRMTRDAHGYGIYLSTQRRTSEQYGSIVARVLVDPGKHARFIAQSAGQGQGIIVVRDETNVQIDRLFVTLP